MGLFSSVKKAFKKVTKGIKKVFKKVTGAVKKVVKGVVKTVGRFANSKLGKAILVGAAIFTGGMAISGAIQGWTGAAAAGTAAGTPATFMTKFVAGSKGFLAGLSSPIAQAKSLLGTGPSITAGIGQKVFASRQGAGLLADVAGGAAGATGAATTAAGPPSVLSAAQQAAVGGPPSVLSAAGVQPAGVAQAAQTAGQAGAGAAAEGGWLSKAGEFAKDFIMSPGGAKLIEAGGNIIQGYGEGAAAEEQLKMEQEFADRYRKEWADPNNPLAQMTRQPGFGQFGTPVGGANQPIYNPGGPIGPGGPMTTQGALPGEPAPVGG